MAKKSTTLISDKLSKVNENFQVYMYDNGFMFEISGRNHAEDWATAKFICATLEDVNALIVEATEMPRDN